MKALSGRGLCKEEPLKLSYISFLVNLSHLKKKKIPHEWQQLHIYMPVLKIDTVILLKHSF